MTEKVVQVLTETSHPHDYPEFTLWSSQDRKNKLPDRRAGKAVNSFDSFSAVSLNKNADTEIFGDAGSRKTHWCVNIIFQRRLTNKTTLMAGHNFRYV